MADDVLRQGVQGISELITQPGLINVDFAHIRQVMQMGGGSMLSIGIGEGPNKAIRAVEHALHHPLLESIAIDDATAIVANFTGGSDMTFMELMEAMNYLQEQTHGRAEIIPGVITDERMQDRTQVILIITGLGATALETRSASINVHAVPMAGRSAAPAPQTSTGQSTRTARNGRCGSGYSRFHAPAHPLTRGALNGSLTAQLDLQPGQPQVS